MVSSNPPPLRRCSGPRLPKISGVLGVLSKDELELGVRAVLLELRATGPQHWRQGVMGEVPMRMTWPASSMAFLAQVTESLQYWIFGVLVQGLARLGQAMTPGGAQEGGAGPRDPAPGG